MAVVLMLAAPFGGRLVGAAAWTVWCGVELAVITLGYNRYRRVRMDSTGAVALQTRDGKWVPATIRPGSVVLRRIAWLRFDAAGGARLAALFRGDCRESEAWRRFRVICRHLGAGP